MAERYWRDGGGFVPSFFEGVTETPLTMLEKDTGHSVLPAMKTAHWRAGKAPGHTQLPLVSNEPSHATALSRRGLATVFSAQQCLAGCVVVGLSGGKMHSNLCLTCLCFWWSLPSVPLMLECNVGLHVEEGRGIHILRVHI